jgi:DNA-binding NtrC family response regulator
VCKSDQKLRQEADIKALPALFFPGPLRNRRPIPEVLMPFTLVLAVGLDSSLVAGQWSAWQSAGYFVTPLKSINEAIVHLREGDFDLVLLGHSIPADSRERFTFLIRASGSRTPVVSITDSSSECDCFADATSSNEPASLLKSIRELLAERARAPALGRDMPAIAA